MTVKQWLSRSNIYMFLIPLLIAAAMLLVGAGIALYVLETVYLPKIGLSLQEMHITLEQYESMFAKFEVFLWVYLGAVGMALLLTIVFTNVFLTRSLFRHISEPLELLVTGVERVEHGNLDTPIAYTGADDYIEKPFPPAYWSRGSKQICRSIAGSNRSRPSPRSWRQARSGSIPRRTRPRCAVSS